MDPAHPVRPAALLAGATVLAAHPNPRSCGEPVPRRPISSGPSFPGAASFSPLARAPFLTRNSSPSSAHSPLLPLPLSLFHGVLGRGGGGGDNLEGCILARQKKRRHWKLGGRRLQI